MFGINRFACLLLFAFSALLSAGGLLLWKSGVLDPQASIEQAPSKESALAWLDTEEAFIWQELKNTYHLDRNEIERNLGTKAADSVQLEALRQLHGTGNTLPDGVLSLALEVFQDVGLDRNEIVLLEIKKSLPPAGTVYNVLMINPVEFLKYTGASQKFIIAHELVHYHYQDDALIGLLKATIKPSQDQLMDQDHIINRISRFHEIRADLKAAQNGPEYVKGLIEYMQFQIGKKSPEAGITHPKFATRLALGQSLIQQSYAVA